MYSLISWVMFILAKRVVKNVSNDIIHNRADWQRMECQCCLYNEKKQTLISNTGMICYDKLTDFNHIDRFQIRIAFMIFSAYERANDAEN